MKSIPKSLFKLFQLTLTALLLIGAVFLSSCTDNDGADLKASFVGTWKVIEGTTTVRVNLRGFDADVTSIYSEYQITFGADDSNPYTLHRFDEQGNAITSRGVYTIKPGPANSSSSVGDIIELSNDANLIEYVLSNDKKQLSYFQQQPGNFGGGQANASNGIDGTYIFSDLVKQ